MPAFVKPMFESQLPRYQPLLDEWKAHWMAGEKKLVLPWSWPRNLYLVVRLMLALNGEGSGAGTGAGAVACAHAPKAQSDKNDETMIDFFFIRVPCGVVEVAATSARCVPSAIRRPRPRARHGDASKPARRHRGGAWRRSATALRWCPAHPNGRAAATPRIGQFALRPTPPLTLRASRPHGLRRCPQPGLARPRSARRHCRGAPRQRPAQLHAGRARRHRSEGIARTGARRTPYERPRVSAQQAGDGQPRTGRP